MNMTEQTIEYGDSDQNRTELDPGDFDLTKEARETIQRQRAERLVDEEYSQKSPFARLTASLSFRQRRKDVEAKLYDDESGEVSEQVKLTAQEEETLELIYEETDNQADELKAVYITLEGGSKISRLFKKVSSHPTVSSLTAGILGGIAGSGKSIAIRTGIRQATETIVSSSIIGGGVAGLVVGGVSMGSREKRKQYSAEGWKRDIERATDIEFSQINNPDEVRALIHSSLIQLDDILTQAFSNNAIQDNAEQTLELASLYRLVKEEDMRRSIDEGKDNENYNQKFIHHIEKLDHSTNELNQAILESVSEENKELYQDILSGKKKEIIKKFALGAVTGALIGASAGYLSELALDNIENQEKQALGLWATAKTWFSERFSGDVENRAQETVSGTTNELGDSPYSHFSQWLEDFRSNMNNPEFANRFDDDGIKPFGFGVETNDVNLAAQEVFDTSKYDSPEFDRLFELISKGNLEGEGGAIELAQNHNIDLNITDLQGHEAIFSEEGSFAQYLHDNWNQIKNLSDVQKWEILSHPEMAENIINNPNAENIAELLDDNQAQAIFLGNLENSDASGAQYLLNLLGSDHPNDFRLLKDLLKPEEEKEKLLEKYGRSAAIAIITLFGLGISYKVIQKLLRKKSEKISFIIPESEQEKSAQHDYENPESSDKEDDKSQQGKSNLIPPPVPNTKPNESQKTTTNAPPVPDTSKLSMAPPVPDTEDESIDNR